MNCENFLENHNELFSTLMTSTTSTLKNLEKACLKPIFGCEIMKLFNIMIILKIIATLFSYIALISKLKDNIVVLSICYLIIALSSSLIPFIIIVPAGLSRGVYINGFLFILILNNVITYLMLEYSEYACCPVPLMIFGPIAITFLIFASVFILYIMLIIISCGVYYPFYQYKKNKKNNIEPNQV